MANCKEGSRDEVRYLGEVPKGLVYLYRYVYFYHFDEALRTSASQKSFCCYTATLL